MVIQKLDHVGIYVKDMQESITFYREALGMEVQKTVVLPSGAELAFLAYPNSGETAVELIARENMNLAETGLVHHLAFTVDNIDDAMRRLTTHGVEWIDPQPNSLPDGGKYIFFLGPNREHLELFQTSPDKAR